MAIRTIEVPFRDDYNIGVGADLASGSPMGFVVDGTAEGVQSARQRDSRQAWALLLETLAGRIR